MSAERRERLASALRERGLDGMVVTHLVNIRYLTGFTGSNGALVLPSDGPAAFLTDGRYRDQAAAELPDIQHIIDRNLIGSAGEQVSGGTWAVETHSLSVDAHRLLTEAAPNATFVAGDRAIEGLRETKDDGEIGALRRACDISTTALKGLLEGPLVGRTERDVARDLENRMFDLGAEAIAFDTILASGENSAIPHHHPTDRLLAKGDLVKADFGARVDGYHADCTRTITLGPADAWQKEIHAAVRESQAVGVAQFLAGNRVAQSDEVARESLEAAGWLEYFTTGIGHGVGLEIHEDPFVAAAHTGKLAPRTVLTMEPGIYVQGRGGVRIEDTVLVTTGAPEVLTAMTTELLEIG